jgi:glyoxylase-like metal-dependent hydrolase (beta-lactamase superfamily II)
MRTNDAQAQAQTQGQDERPTYREIAHIEPFYDPRTSTLTYVVFDQATRDAVVIDPVLDYDPASGTTWTESFDRVAAYVERERLRLQYVLETHAHADHLSGSRCSRATRPYRRHCSSCRSTTSSSPAARPSARSS